MRNVMMERRPTLKSTAVVLMERPATRPNLRAQTVANLNADAESSDSADNHVA
jgi:hypothetical protein